MEKRRWYDYNENILELLAIMEKLPNEVIEDLAENIVNFSNLLRKNIEENEEEAPLSIGKKRVLGLYKSFKRRRWYDKNWTLLSMMNVLATLPKEDFDNIASGTLTMIEEGKK